MCPLLGWGAPLSNLGMNNLQQNRSMDAKYPPGGVQGKDFVCGQGCHFIPYQH
jgi:hypothetical protein